AGDEWRHERIDLVGTPTDQQQSEKRVRARQHQNEDCNTEPLRMMPVDRREARIASAPGIAAARVKAAVHERTPGAVSPVGSLATTFCLFAGFPSAQLRSVHVLLLECTGFKPNDCSFARPDPAARGT